MPDSATPENSEPLIFYPHELLLLSATDPPDAPSEEAFLEVMSLAFALLVTKSVTLGGDDHPFFA